MKSPVTLIFFNRPNTLEKVFEKVRQAKPPKLFLVQDGARDGRQDDEENITKCRKIVDNIDWECEVFKNYSEKNLGCGQRPQSGITWVLNQVEQTIILEDDCVPSMSFFNYCDEMLEKYKNDERICYISGLNHFEEWNVGADYFFTKTGAIWGWATWRRAWIKYYDYYLKSLDGNKYELSLVKKQISNKNLADIRFKTWQKSREALLEGENLSYWDIQWGFVKYSQNMLVIVPKRNLICNIGIGESSTHARATKKKEFKKGKSFFFIPAHELEFPLKHPKFVVCDLNYDNLVYKTTGGNSLRKCLSKIIKKILRKR